MEPSKLTWFKAISLYLILCILVAFLFAALASLASCNKLEQGEVIKHTYEPENTTVIFMPMTIDKSTILIPYVLYDGEDYILTIRGTYKGDERTETIYVSKEDYDCVANGSTFIVNESCSYSDNNNIKTKK